MTCSKHHHHHHGPKEENKTGIKYTAKEMREVTKISSEEYLETLRAQVDHIEEDIMTYHMMPAATKNKKSVKVSLFSDDYSFLNDDVIKLLKDDYRSIGYNIKVENTWYDKRGIIEIILEIKW